MKNWQEAHSQTARDRVWNQWLGTLRHRLDDEHAPIIVCHARWHEDDMTGRLLDAARAETGEAWELVDLAAIAEKDRPDPLGREPGEVLEPERFPVEAVQARHHAMGTYLVAALEQQRPAPPEGNELLRDWFGLVEPSEMPRAPDLAVTAWDTKLKDNEAGDFVVGQVWWRVAGVKFLVDQLRGRFDHATTANAVALLAIRHPEVNAHYLEAAASAPEVIANLRKPVARYQVTDEMAARLGMTPAERQQVGELRRGGMANLQAHPVKGDKSVRARTYIAPDAEAGNVRIRADSPWLAALLDELSAFPDGGHDDQVDAMSFGLSKLGEGRRRRPVRRVRSASRHPNPFGVGWVGVDHRPRPTAVG